ncbi:tRNA1(Val) (adenine(37)-N6)-methyltransferase [Desulfonatronum thioautotrophicum]|uniref:tRNA1(Val) (adenine(37)-N6)-methyltransferase n=1 Tax=Desulfonatronum thioautotrophicum TaxID=617001 RepID=UPI0005EAF8B0|nr:methyltransferase [Desulfonatronum thioautotrophicum]
MDSQYFNDPNPHRRAFPRGLLQPKHGFRFSIDALLLACFAAYRTHRNVIDLGTGCGVVGLGLLLLDSGRRFARKPFKVIGIDNNLEMVALAQANAERLDFAKRFTAIHGNVRDIDKIREFQPGEYDAALCNPPYRLAGQGRLPNDPAKQSAMFEIAGQVEDFLQAAKQVLATKGRMYMVHLPEHLPRLLQHLEAARLAPKRLRLVHPHRDKPASLLLLEAVKGGKPGLSVAPPLIVYHRVCTTSAGQTIHQTTDEALAFCPFLDCNSTRPVATPLDSS